MTLEQVTNTWQAAKANLDKAYEKPANSQFGVGERADCFGPGQARSALLAPIAPETIAQAKAKVYQAFIAWQQART